MNDNLRDEERKALHAATDRRSRLRAKLLLEWALTRWGALLFVFLPTLIAATYYFLIAADLYSSEARFIVRSPSKVQLSGLAGLLQGGGGLSRAGDDVYSVQEFAISRDALTALQKKLDLRAIYGRPEADFLARYPSLVYRNTAEDFFRYYQQRIDVAYDTTTGVTTLLVKAFRADDAHNVAELLLDESEALVNRLNERAHANSVKDAEADIKDAAARVSEAQQNLLDYRNREVLLDPSKTSGAIFETLAKMQAERSNTVTRLSELERTSPGSPLLSGLQSHTDALRREIDIQRAKLAGAGGSMAPKISEYEQLALRAEFAGKLLASSLASLEAARAEARRQQIYIDRVVDASMPDKALYPKRLRSVAIIFTSLFLLYSMGKLLISGVREHAQQ